MNENKHKILNSSAFGHYLSLTTTPPESLEQVTNTLVDGAALNIIDWRIAKWSYVLFRTVIGTHLTAAIKSGKVLLQEMPVVSTTTGESIYSYGAMNFSDWHTALPESTRQHYNCEHCKKVWALIAGLVVLNDDGSLTYPVLEAARELAITDTVVEKALGGLKSVEDRKLRLLPVSQLPEFLYKSEDGVFNHFYLSDDKSVLTQYNIQRKPFTNLKYVLDIFEKFMSKDLNVDFLASLFVYIDAHIESRGHTALAYGEALVKIIRKTRHMQDSNGMGLLSLWSDLNLKSNSWMQNTNGSLLGIVLDIEAGMKEGGDMDIVLTRVKSLLSQDWVVCS